MNFKKSVVLFLSSFISTIAMAGSFETKIGDINKINYDFKQTLYGNDGKILQESTGTFKLDKKYGFKWSVDSPYSEQIIFDKKELYIYDPDLEQVRIDKVENNDRFLSIFFNKNDFDENFITNEISSNLYEIMPKDNNLNMKYTVKFGNRNIDEIVIDDGIGQKTFIDFLKYKNTNNLKRNDFNFELTDELEVIKSTSSF